MKKSLSILLSFVMIMTALTALPFTALAVTYPATAVSINSIALSSETPCFMNGASAPCAYTENANLYYDETTSTLTLNNYNGEIIRFSQTGGDVTVNLIGNNVIDGWQYGIIADGSALTVTSKTNGTLSISTRNPASGGGIVNYWNNDNNLPLTISGNANITINQRKETADVYGIHSHGKISIIDDASVSIASFATDNVHNPYCIDYAAVEINTTGNISLEVGNRGNSPVALAASSINLISVNKLSIKGNGSGTDCICNSSNYNYLLGLKGYEIKTANEGDDYSLILTKHKLTPVNEKTPTCTETGNNLYYHCEGCDKYFKDSEGTVETTVEAETIEALGHTMTPVAAKAANCTEDGNNAYYYCEVCKKYFKDEAGSLETTVEVETIKASGHDFSDNAEYCKNGCNTKNPDYKAPEDEEKPETPKEEVTAQKKANTLFAKAKTVKIKLAKLKKKKVVIKRKKAITVKNAKGKVSFKKVKGNKKITVNKKNGKITVKKGLKKGTYKIKIKVTAEGNNEYEPVTKTVSVKIKVK